MKSKKTKIEFVREQDAPILPPPPSEAGITGWLWQNVFMSMSNYSSVRASIGSIGVILLTIFLIYFGFGQIFSLLDFAVLSAVWDDPEGRKREVCWTIEQGGIQPNGWHGACWPYLIAKLKFVTYGAYPSDELWRVNSVFIIGALGALWLMIERMPYRRYVGLFMLTIFPLISLILLSGGYSETSMLSVSVLILIGLALLTLARLSFRGFLGKQLNSLSKSFSFIGWAVVIWAVVKGVLATDFQLEPVDTRDWGGILVTLVVAVAGIVASLPLGVVLALGRRSSMPVARLFCTLFIEFWRAIPLISVLFMASVMLPLFLPEGANFDNLLRALIGVTLFSAAYMAEVIRGGLQAIDKGQYEAAQSVGLSYWQSMRHIILPQALTHVIPGIINTFIGIFKDTTLVSIVGIFDLLGAGQATLADASWSTPVQSLTVYLYVALVFFFCCFGMSRYSLYIERKLSKSR